MYLSLCLKTLFHFKNRQMFLAHPVYWWANDIQLNILRLVSFSSCPPTKRRRGKYQCPPARTVRAKNICV